MNKNNTKLRCLGALTGMVLLFSFTVTPAWADRKTDAERLRSAVEHGGIMKHLEALQKIADRNGGNRQAINIQTKEKCQPKTLECGDFETRNYIARVLNRAGLNVTRIPVVFENFHQLSPSILELTSPPPPPFVQPKEGDAPSDDYSIVQNSISGETTNNIQAVDIMDPPAAVINSSSSGCTVDDFVGFKPGNIALIQRGGGLTGSPRCNYTTKVVNAQNAGASGVIIFNEGNPGLLPRNVLAGGVIGVHSTIPVVITSYALGKELYDLSKQGDVEVHLKTDVEFIPSETENIIAETETGRSDHVIMVGAHLDSVEEGPGINDNGSAIGTLLEIAKSMQRLHIQPLNQVRFAFWGAEEAGQVGSIQYVDDLVEVDEANGTNEVGKIAFYLNADMLGSPNFVPSVYDADASDEDSTLGPVGAPGSELVEKVLVDYFKTAKPYQAAPTPLSIDGRSDYRAFLVNGIPFAAITSGFDGKKTEAEAAIFGGTAGAEYDACYHKACDTIHNVSEDSLDLMSGALVHTIMEFATRDVIFP